VRTERSMKTDESIREGLRQLPIRPVYLVSTAHEGKRNIITIGMFAVFSGNPTLVGIGVKPQRFSHEMIRKSGEYVVNVVDEKLRDAVRICGERSGRDCDKFNLAQLTPVAGASVGAPCIQESPVSVECRVVQETETGDHTWFIAEVRVVHVKKGYDWKRGLLFKWIGRDGFYFKLGQKIGQY